MSDYKILDFDSELFGFKVAKISINKPSITQFEKIVEELNNLNVKLAYYTTSVDCSSSNIMSKYNLRLVDVKTTFSKGRPGFHESIKLDNILAFNDNKPVTELYDIAFQCGEYSRFKTDPNIKDEVFEKLYKTWIEKSVTKELADEILVYQINDVITGLITVYVKDSVGSIGLVGVDKKYRSQGIGKMLIAASDNYFRKAGCKNIEVVTQGENKPACLLYETNGFSVKSQINFYHLWL